MIPIKRVFLSDGFRPSRISGFTNTFLIKQQCPTTRKPSGILVTIPSIAFAISSIPFTLFALSIGWAYRQIVHIILTLTMREKYLGLITGCNVSPSLGETKEPAAITLIFTINTNKSTSEIYNAIKQHVKENALDANKKLYASRKKRMGFLYLERNDVEILDDLICLMRESDLKGFLNGLCHAEMRANFDLHVGSKIYNRSNDKLEEGAIEDEGRISIERNRNTEKHEEDRIANKMSEKLEEERILIDRNRSKRCNNIRDGNRKSEKVEEGRIAIDRNIKGEQLDGERNGIDEKQQEERMAIDRNDRSEKLEEIDRNSSKTCNNIRDGNRKSEEVEEGRIAIDRNIKSEQLDGGRNGIDEKQQEERIAIERSEKLEEEKIPIDRNSSKIYNNIRDRNRKSEELEKRRIAIDRNIKSEKLEEGRISISVKQEEERIAIERNKRSEKLEEKRIPIDRNSSKIYSNIKDRTNNKSEQLEKGKIPIVIRIHHCLVDGLSFYKLATQLFCLKSDRMDSYADGLSNALERSVKGINFYNAEISGLYPVACPGDIFLDADSETVLTYLLESREKYVPSVKRIKRHFHGVSFNAVVLTAFSASLADFYIKKCKPDEIPERITTTVPVQMNYKRFKKAYNSTQHENYGNDYSFVVPKLCVIPAEKRGIPIEEYIVDRMFMVQEELDRVYQSGETILNQTLMNTILEVTPLDYAKAGYNYGSMTAAISSIPGGPPVQFFTGEQVEDVLFFTLKQATMGMCFTISTYANKLQLGLKANKTKFTTPDELDEILQRVFHYIDILEQKTIN